jgi:hypothetical protein
MDSEKGGTEVSLQDVFQASFDRLDLDCDPVQRFAIINLHHPHILRRAGRGVDEWDSRSQPEDRINPFPSSSSSSSEQVKLSVLPLGDPMGTHERRVAGDSAEAEVPWTGAIAILIEGSTSERLLWQVAGCRPITV